jgi:hypothetical protein
VVIGLDQLSPAERIELTAAIEEARAASPAAFEAVAAIRARLAELDAGKRGPAAVVTPMLKAIGPDGLYAMIEQIAAGGERGDLDESAWVAWRAALLEATGMLRDPRAEPVLTAVLDSAAGDHDVAVIAAEALARLGTDSAAAKLVSMAKRPGPGQVAVLAGMGECRRAVVAQALATAIAARPDAATAKHIVRSLGDVGSAWAWETAIVAASGEGAATRALAAAALVTAYATYDGEVRQSASNAILVVDDPSTPALVQRAKKGASPEVASALDALAARFARNPAR